MRLTSLIKVYTWLMSCVLDRLNDDLSDHKER